MVSSAESGKAIALVVPGTRCAASGYVSDVIYPNV